MAFYPDELSPIDRAVSGNMSDSLDVIGKNRRQWKSLVFGKSDNFDTIDEEKEDEILMDESIAPLGKIAVDRMSNLRTAVENKKITFPKPRKYISSRVPDLSELPARINDVYAASVPSAEFTKVESDFFNNSKTKLPLDDMSSLPDIPSFVLNDLSSETSWKDFAVGTLSGWPKIEEDEAPKKKVEEKKKSSNSLLAKKETSSRKQSAAKKPESKSRKTDKGKPLNMKEVVKVYKQLAYGTKEEIKNFVEKLEYVKEDPKGSNDKDLLSMMNLKVLESKIREFGKKGPKSEHSRGTQEVKKKPLKKVRKAHIDHLARHKVVRVPATLDYTYSVSKQTLRYGSNDDKEVVMSRRNKRMEEKEPWKYVGASSALNNNYFVYPACLNKPKKSTKKKSCNKSEMKTDKKTKQVENDKKVKLTSATEILSRSNYKSLSREVGSTSSMRLSGSFFKEFNRPTATSVCTVEFPFPGAPDRTDPSLLVYLHGPKPKFSGYSDKQFSRVKFFRNAASVPLVKGIDKKSLVKQSPNAVTVKKVNFSGDSPDVRFFDVLDFDEDIETINDFLRRETLPLEGASESRNRNNLNQGRPRIFKPVDYSHGQQPLDDGDKISPDLIFNEISRDLTHFQDLPDTEENRKVIANFFDEIDQRIEETKAQQLMRNADRHYGRMIPIVGY